MECLTRLYQFNDSADVYMFFIIKFSQNLLYGHISETRTPLRGACCVGLHLYRPIGQFLVFCRTLSIELSACARDIIQTEAERRRREAGVKQSMEIRVRSCMYVGMYVWYLELSREPRHVAQQTRYQNVDLGNGHCLGTISSGCDF